MAQGEANPSDAAISILLVDDNEQNLELMAAYIEELGCQMHMARDGVEALEQVSAHRPDLILLDVMMPRMSGFQVCKKLKSDDATREIPIVMVTALSEVSDVEHAVDVGADDFLSKPVNRLELLTRVRSLLKLASARRELRRAMDEIKRLST
jgi:two-component system alkaline phosphatase synthesis response regulator PhoP